MTKQVQYGVTAHLVATLTYNHPGRGRRTVQVRAESGLRDHAVRSELDRIAAVTLAPVDVRWH